jgi:hypothetical protein
VGTGLNTPALLFGIILLVASIGLFFWGRLKPELARDSDNVYSVIGIICSVILFTSAFDLSLILGFQQLLLIGAVIALMWENIQKREPMAMAPRRDDDRSPRRPYRAEYEETGYSGNAGGRFGGSDDRAGRGLPRRDYDDRGNAPKNDRYLGSEEPKPSRDAGRGSRRNRDEESNPRDNSWGDEPPRTIPERSSRGERPVNDLNDPSAALRMTSRLLLPDVAMKTAMSSGPVVAGPRLRAVNVRPVVHPEAMTYGRSQTIARTFHRRILSSLPRSQRIQALAGDPRTNGN